MTLFYIFVPVQWITEYFFHIFVKLDILNAQLLIVPSGRCYPKLIYSWATKVSAHLPRCNSILLLQNSSLIRDWNLNSLSKEDGVTLALSSCSSTCSIWLPFLCCCLDGQEHNQRPLKIKKEHFLWALPRQ